MYRRETLAEDIACKVSTIKQCVIGITGISCVGKSTFTQMIKKQLEEQFKVQVISVDCYLKEAYRGGTKFWDKSCEYLKPEFFNWKELKEDICKLQEGTEIERAGYVRGIGWDNVVKYEPSDFYLLEGLFLDSLQAAECMKYDELIKFTAKDEFIRKLRMERDDYYRENFKEFTRTKEETLKEIESTLKAEKSYQAAIEKWNHIELVVSEGFWLEIEKEGKEDT